MIKPNLFIVGAPRSGTTAFGEFLRVHPEVFMAGRRGMHQFGLDLPFVSPLYQRDLGRYLAEFEPGRGKKILLETSVWYIYSRTAPREFLEFNPAARAIIMLRNPLEMIPSLHSRMVLDQFEPILDFNQAMAAEPLRAKKRGQQEDGILRSSLLYRKAARLSPCVKTYLEIMGRDRVHIIIHDDLKKDPGEIYRQTLEFLGVDQSYRPPFKTINPNRKFRSPALQKFILQPPAWLSALGQNRVLEPAVARLRLRGRLTRLNTKTQPRPPMDPELREQLKAEFVPEVENLSRVLGRDLTGWLD